MKCPRCGSERVNGRAETLPPQGEADHWAPVREQGFLCAACGLMEESQTDAGADYEAFRARWGFPLPTPPSAAEQEADHRRRDADDIERARAWTWPSLDPTNAKLDRAGREAWLARKRAERTFSYADLSDPRAVSRKIPSVPRNEQIERRILAAPDDAAPRWELVHWLRRQHHPTARFTADFIEGQLKIAEAYAVDPKSDIRGQLVRNAFSPDLDSPWWHRWPSDLAARFVPSLYVLDGWGYVASGAYYRGFVESVAIKAETFLEIADELFSLAPIRQLAITYCKGLHHDDEALWRALLASPHLDRIRALRFPVRAFGKDKGDFTKLNHLTDRDIELLASSEHLRGLRVLDLEDERLSIHAFDALAATKKLPELSAVLWDLYSYIDRPSFKAVPTQQRQGPTRPLHAYAADLETRHGALPWLHVAEHYGSDEPDIEAVIEHPVAVTGIAKRTTTNVDKGEK